MLQYIILCYSLPIVLDDTILNFTILYDAIPECRIPTIEVVFRILVIATPPLFCLGSGWGGRMLAGR